MKTRKMFVPTVFVLEVFLLVSCVSAESVADTRYSVKVEAAHKWIQINAIFRGFVESWVDETLPTVMSTMSSLNMTVQCTKQVRHLMRGFRQLQPWAVKFIDSSGKSMDGLLNGVVASFGVYDECIDIAVRNERNISNELFRGQYCSIDVKPPVLTESEVDETVNYMINVSSTNTMYNLLQLPMKYIQKRPFRIGVCVPSGCTQQDVDKAAKFIAETLLLKGEAVRCEVKETTKLSFLQNCIVCFFSILGCVTLVGSLLDVYLKYKCISTRSKIHCVFVLFSVFKNTRSLFQLEKEKKELRCLNGIRFLSLIVIICGHAYLFVSYRAMTNILDYFNFDNSFATQILSNSNYCTDTFFFMSGFLACYSEFVQVKHLKLPFSFTISVIRRLFRVYPLYVTSILSSFLIEEMGSGPIWHEYLHVARITGKNCYKTWWRNLLFTANFLPEHEKCLAPTWYLDVDFQLYLLALLMIMVLLRYPKRGITLLAAVVTVFMVTGWIFFYTYQTLPFVVTEKLFTTKAFANRQFFFSPLAHIAVYCIGILAGYFYAVEPDIKITKKQNITGWILALACMFLVMFGTVYWRKGRMSPTFFTAIYGSIGRPLWALGVSWVIICCATGHGGIANSLLSCKAFIPLSRLSFTVCMIHPVIQAMLTASTHTLFTATHLNMIWICFASFASSFLLAFLATIIIEKPFISLGNMILTNLMKPSKKEKSKTS